MPTETIPVSDEAAESLDNAWESAVERSVETGAFTIVISEMQLTSLVAQSLAKQESPPLRDPQVYLRDGQLQVYGVATQGNVDANVLLSLAVSVDADGYPDIEIVSGNFGPFPIPDEVLAGFSSVIDEAFTGEFGPAATGIRIESIMIDGGLMSITGRLR
ncbi:MAG: hypothetical protein R3335_07400 [Anaerolineales bacterium]|nr:hypothetical protein [Anaerolineales bacterium]